MTGLLGEGLLLLSICVCIYHLFFKLHYGDVVITLCLVGMFGIFLYAHVTDDFSLVNVYQHSHTQKPLLYKIAGTWGSHEGSMLLWCLLLSVYHMSARLLRLPSKFQSTLTFLFTLLLLSFLFFLYMGSNPFERLLTPPLEGQDLNPVLQDFSLSIHPPHLYLGTLGFSMPFMLSLTSLIHKDIARERIRQLHITTIVALSFLTTGILLGSVWAYYELGWGGWWFFDPVENLALIPWLLGVIGLHITLITFKKGTHIRLCMISNMAPFLSCLLSLTLIRSGLLNSVHSFALDEKRGLLLSILSVFWVALSVLIYRKYPIPSRAVVEDKPGDKLLLTAMGFITFSAIALIIGTILPLFLDFFKSGITLSHRYFFETFIPLWIPPLVILPFAIWRRVRRRTMGRDILRHTSHIGLFLAVIGIALSSFLHDEDTCVMKVGERRQLCHYDLELLNVRTVNGPNYKAVQGQFCLYLNSGEKHFEAEERFYWTQESRHLESALLNTGLSQLIVLFVKNPDTTYTVKVISKPFIMLMWSGFVLMILGLILSFITRVKVLKKSL